MFNPLSLEQDECIELKGNTFEKEVFSCIEILNFCDAQKSLACRYRLLGLETKREIWLEVKKDRAQNYQLFYYEEVEYIENSTIFLSLAGIETLAYQKPYEDKKKIYSIVPKKGEELIEIKHLVSEDELPPNPLQNGYNKDGNSNWYFMTKRSKGTIKNFDNSIKKRSWEYKYNQNRLLIEIDDIDNRLQDITIYEGEELARRDIKKISSTSLVEV